jgi:hypothetical protein
MIIAFNLISGATKPDGVMEDLQTDLRYFFRNEVTPLQPNERADIDVGYNEWEYSQVLAGRIIGALVALTNHRLRFAGSWLVISVWSVMCASFRLGGPSPVLVHTAGRSGLIMAEELREVPEGASFVESIDSAKAAKLVRQVAGEASPFEAFQKAMTKAENKRALYSEMMELIHGTEFAEQFVNDVFSADNAPVAPREVVRITPFEFVGIVEGMNVEIDLNDDSVTLVNMEGKREDPKPLAAAEKAINGVLAPGRGRFVGGVKSARFQAEPVKGLRALIKWRQSEADMFRTPVIDGEVLPLNVILGAAMTSVMEHEVDGGLSRTQGPLKGLERLTIHDKPGTSDDRQAKILELKLQAAADTQMCEQLRTQLAADSASILKSMNARAQLSTLVTEAKMEMRDKLCATVGKLAEIRCAKLTKELKSASEVLVGPNTLDSRVLRAMIGGRN